MMLGKVTPFVHNTYKIVSEAKSDDVVSWNQSGDAFVIKDQYRFQTEVLPCYFKHNNLSSFIRQLNTYQFHKVPGDNINYGNPEHIIFSHPQFLRDREDLLPNIVRRHSKRNSSANILTNDDSTSSNSPFSSPSMQTNSIVGLDPSSLSPEQMALQVIQMRKRLDETNNLLQTVHNDLIRTKGVLHQLQQSSPSNTNYSNFSNFEPNNPILPPENTSNTESYRSWYEYRGTPDNTDNNDYNEDDDQYFG